MQSILFVPAGRGDLVGKAASGEAAIVCLDLEDGVAPDAKAAARGALQSAVDRVRAGGKPVAVRLNSALEHVSHDLAALPEGLDLLVLPKAGSVAFIEDLSGALERLHGFVPALVALVETAAGLTAMSRQQALPAAVAALALGTEDLAADLGVAPESAAIEHSFHELARNAARLRVPLLGYPGSIANFSDPKLFEAAARAGREGGAIGGFAIHPKQVAVLNAVFALSDDERRQAEAEVAAFEAGLAQGLGAVNHEGRMIDRPVYLAARRRLAFG